MTVKNFGFAAKRKANEGKGKPARKDIPFKLDGPRDTVMFHVRGDLNGDALAVLSAQFVRAEGTQDYVEMSAGMFDMLDALFTPDTAKALLAKIKNADDGFGFGELGEVIEWAMEQHTGGRPTTSPST